MHLLFQLVLQQHLRKKMTQTPLLVALKTIKILSMWSKVVTYLLSFLLHNFLGLISLWKQFSILIISLSRNFVCSVKFILLTSFIFEITQIDTIIILKDKRRKHARKTTQFFTCNHKINESNAKVPTHYWVICLYSKNVWYDIFMSDKAFNMEHVQHQNYRN